MEAEAQTNNGKHVLEIERRLSGLDVIIVGTSPQDGEIHMAPRDPIFDLGKLDDFAVDLISPKMTIKHYGIPIIRKVGGKNAILLPEYGLETNGSGRVRAIIYPSENVAIAVLKGEVGCYTNSSRLAVYLEDLKKYAPDGTKFPRASR